MAVSVVLVGAGDANGAPQAQTSFTCTEIVGFSQTMQWYFGGPFTDYAGPGRWQLRWAGGAAIDSWADPSFSGWSPQYRATSCTQGSESPDRVLLNIAGGDYISDVSWWRQQISAAITNIRSKYPNERQIILQSVVSGPGDGLCFFSGTTVRDTYNTPYIHSAIGSLVAAEVVSGMAPAVRSCGDYADWVGHLTDDAKGPIGVAIGQYYAQFSGGGPTPVATSTPVVGSQTVTFDDLLNSNRALNGQYPNGLIDWGTNAWYLSGPWGQFTTNSVGFNGAGPTSASFTFISPSKLLQLDAYNGGATASTITLSCAGQSPVSAAVTPAQRLSIQTGWTGACTGVTIGSTNGWNTNFDNLVLGAGPPAATSTPVPSNCPCTIWPSSAIPNVAANADSNPVEIGLKFRVDQPGHITGIRFYKASTNTGSHVADLWSSTGTLIASANFAAETASGWQQANFAAPVSIAANTTYIASYHTNLGQYAADQNYFATQGVNNAPLHALQSGADGGNGVYAYGSISNFPANTYNATNYWVDVVFTTP